ncbi:hypothetical protein QOZ80_4AG0310640 [Eleusine coracana subsp. coracana]|nr:hypothetical protein QOZ80_4AG0310640 [Eleusine coracana subsp. coracana]
MEPDLEAASPNPQAPAADWIRIEHLLVFAVASCVVTLVCFLVFYPSNTLLPTFAVDLAAVEGLDGDPTTSPLNATFELTLHGVTRPRRVGKTLGIWQDRGTVAVSYAGAVLAWGRVPQFCVPEQGQARVRVVALGAGVRISDELRGRMASERAARAAEVDVDMMLDRSRLLSCRVKLDEPSPQPSPCKVFTLDYF